MTTLFDFLLVGFSILCILYLLFTLLDAVIYEFDNHVKAESIAASVLCAVALIVLAAFVVYSIFVLQINE